MIPRSGKHTTYAGLQVQAHTYNVSGFRDTRNRVIESSPALEYLAGIRAIRHTYIHAAILD